MVVNIHLTKEEKQIADTYVKQHGVSLSTAMKEIFFEKIEDEYDIAVAEMELNKYKKNPETYSHEEVKEILDID